MLMIIQWGKTIEDINSIGENANITSDKGYHMIQTVIEDYQIDEVEDFWINFWILFCYTLILCVAAFEMLIRFNPKTK